MVLKIAVLIFCISILNVNAKTKNQKTDVFDNISEIKVHCDCDKENNGWIKTERLPKKCLLKLARKHKTVRL